MCYLISEAYLSSVSDVVVKLPLRTRIQIYLTKKDEMRRKRDREQVKGSIQIQLSIDESVRHTVFTQIILWVGDRCISFSPYTYFFLSFSIFLLLIVVVAVPLLLLLFRFVLTFLHFSLHASLWQIYCIRIV